VRWIRQFLSSAASDASDQGNDRYAAARERMVREQLEARGIDDPDVLRAMAVVPRHRFVPEELAPSAYEDRPLAIGSGQTISQPYVAALMTHVSGAKRDSRVLEIGTGCGYQTAVLLELGCEVFSVEIRSELLDLARRNLFISGYSGAHLSLADGFYGLPQHAPFDAILCAAAPAEVPSELVSQLRDGGKLVVPVGCGDQELRVVERRGGATSERAILPVRFVPMLGHDSPE
jgi:protein-L-isoaspartate(D-aspartate) O-methyltransferase